MIPSLPHFIFFALATLILNLIPGSDVLYIASQTLRSKKQGVIATLGTSTGVLTYILLTTLGLTAVLGKSPIVFDVVKFGGASYLLYLAWKLWRQKTSELHLEKAHKAALWQAYYRGICSNLLNPKVGLFFLTFLPQFVDVSRGHVSLQLLTLGTYFIISGTTVNLLYVFLFAHLKQRVLTQFPLHQYLNKISGGVFCIIALAVLMTKPH